MRACDVVRGLFWVKAFALLSLPTAVPCAFLVTDFYGACFSAGGPRGLYRSTGGLVWSSLDCLTTRCDGGGVFPQGLLVSIVECVLSLFFLF